MSSLDTTPQQAVSLADKAYFAIREMIVSLRLRPGSVVDERGLVETLGIGRTPVREALRRLAQEQLVDVYPRRGMFVTTVEIRDLASVSEVRGVLESHAAYLAAKRRTNDELEELRRLDGLLDDHASLDQRELMTLDEQIHRTIYRLAHNPFLEQTLEEYFVHALRIWHLALDRASGLESAVLSHRPLLTAIRKGDADAAARIMRKHVAEFEKAIRRALVEQ